MATTLTAEQAVLGWMQDILLDDKEQSTEINIDEQSSLALRKFITQRNTILLKAARLDSCQPPVIHLSNNINNHPEVQEQAVVVKLKPCSLTRKNFYSSTVCWKLMNDPLASCLQTLRFVYVPLLKQQNLIVGEQVSRILSLMQASTNTIDLFKNLVQDLTISDLNEEEVLAYILTPLDEVLFWDCLSRESTEKDLRRGASQVKEILDSSLPLFLKLHQPMIDLKDIETMESEIDCLLDGLRAIWKAGITVESKTAWMFSEKRIKIFLDMVSVQLSTIFQVFLEGCKSWIAPQQEVETQISPVVKIITLWIESTSILCQDFALGVDTSERQWNQEGYHPPVLPTLSIRLNQILDLRISYGEFCGLLEGKEMCATTEEAFTAVAELSVMEWLDDAKWNQAIQTHESYLNSKQATIAETLKDKFNSDVLPMLRCDDGSIEESKLLHCLEQLLKYRRILLKNEIRWNIQDELRKVSKACHHFLDRLEADFEDHQENVQTTMRHYDTSRTKETPSLAQKQTFTLHIINTSSRIKTAIELFSPLSIEADELTQSSIELATELSNKAHELRKKSFEWWKKAMLSRWITINHSTAGQLIEFQPLNNKTTPSPGALLRLFFTEVHAMSSTGVKIPDQLQQILEENKENCKFSEAIDEIYKSYEELKMNLCPSHAQLLHKDISQLEAQLTNPVDVFGNRITWNNTKSVFAYCKKLEKTMDSLYDKHTFVRSVHRKIEAHVLSLVKLNLVTEKAKWNEQVEEIEDILNETLSQGYDASCLETWRQYWDIQLYKVLETKFSYAIENFLRILPRIDISLVLRANEVCLDPTVEEMRASILSNFVNPMLHDMLSVKGLSSLSDTPDFFQSILSRKAKQLTTLYREIESTISLLREELKQQQDWMRDIFLDLNEVVENMEDVSDWENCFQGLQTKTKELDRLPVEKYLQCFRLSFVPLKLEARTNLRSLRQVFIDRLQNKVLYLIEEVTSFVHSGEQILDSDPSTMSDISQNLAESNLLLNSLSDMVQKQKLISEMNILLKKTTGEDPLVEEHYVVVSQWDDFITRLETCGDIRSSKKQTFIGKLESKADSLRAELLCVSGRWKDLKPASSTNVDTEVILARIQQFSDEVISVQTQIINLCEDFVSLHLPAPEFEGLDSLLKDLNSTKDDWQMFVEFTREHKNLLEKKWLLLREKVWEIEDFVEHWSKTAKETCSGSGPAALVLFKELDPLRKLLPYVSEIKGVNWDQRHWKMLFRLLEFSQTNTASLDDLQLRDLVAVVSSIAAKVDEVRALDAQARGESLLRSSLDELTMWGFERKFAFTECSISVQEDVVVVVQDWTKLIEEVVDNQQIAIGLESSSHSYLLKGEIESWTDQLTTLSAVLTELCFVQQKWISLAPVFAQDALPAFQRNFKKADQQFRALLHHIQADRVVLHLLEVPNLQTILSDCLADLSDCQSSLMKFLEEQRAMFPRFYFVGNIDLLMMLGQRQHIWFSLISKIFNGVSRLVIKENSGQKKVEAVLTEKGESLALSPSVDVVKDLRQWLNSLEDAIVSTLKTQLVARITKVPDILHDRSCTQVFDLASSIIFTKSAENSIENLDPVKRKIEEDLKVLCERKDWRENPITRLKGTLLVTNLIYQQDTVNALLDAGVTNCDDWEWNKALRFYHTEEKVLAEIVNGRFEYGWEFQGTTQKLVHTPLTDKCFVVLTEALVMGYGGSPYGPAGTGKTETVKALGQALGRRVLVFNCDENFEIGHMGRVFLGLMSCGFWGCFDEFNRLESSVLSSVAQQIQTIQTAMRDGRKSLLFLDKQVALHGSTGIFVTMNPAGKQYGGRSKLPDNLKQLFRPVSMTHPNNTHIMQVLLAVEGFSHNRQLGKKISDFFPLCAELLTQQRHYDWGLRALKSVVESAGRKLRSDRQSTEEECLVHALRVMKLPSLTTADGQVFLELLSNVFPTACTGVLDCNRQSLLIAAGKMKMEIREEQIRKCYELDLAMEQRMGVIILGGPLSGKSTIWKLLHEACILDKKYFQHHTMAYICASREPALTILSPKAVDKREMLGWTDADTGEWNDGLLTMSLRKSVEIEQRSWVVCDGDIDPEWIESLNSVLDDNKLLTLPNGERIQLSCNLNLIFETTSLEFASPATISRCAVICLTDTFQYSQDSVLLQTHLV